MITGNEQIDITEPSSLTDLNSSRKMQGWIKLMQTFRQSDPPTNEPVRVLPNSVLNNTFSNGTSSQQEQNLFQESLPYTTMTTRNNHRLQSSDNMITLDSPPNIFNSPTIVSLASTPGQTTDDLPVVENDLVSEARSRRESLPSIEIESTTTSSSTSTDSKQSPTRSKKIIIRKTTRPRESTSTARSTGMSTPFTEDISDDDMPLVDIRKQKIKSIDSLSTPLENRSIIPLATDLLSLPGHIQNEPRDVRFLTYLDVDTLSTHLHICLYLDRQSSLSSPTRSYIFKTRYNVLNKIFKMDYRKTLQKNLHLEKKVSFIKHDQHRQQPLSVISSPTSASFRMDWSVNRRSSSSTHRHTAKNVFHILQLQPQKQFVVSNNSMPSSSKSIVENFESIKDILARTYYPHLHTAIEYGYQFGEKSKFPSTQQLISTHNDIIPIKEMPQSPDLITDSTTITLKSPPSVTRRNSVVSQTSPIIMKSRPQLTNNLKNGHIQSLSSIHIEPSTSNDIDGLLPWNIKKSIVVLTPTKIPLRSAALVERENSLNNNRKRKSSSTVNTNIIEKKKKRVVSAAASSEIINHFEDISEPESEEDVLPSELPKQYFIKNGLRSIYYKSKTDNKSKSISSKTRLERRRRQSSGSLPPFYTGIFESDDEKSPYVDYCLPYDIYWHGQQQVKETTVINLSTPVASSTTTTTASNSHHQKKKKKSNEPKQKQPSPFRKILRNVYTDQLRQSLPSSFSSDEVSICDCKPPDTCEDGACMNRNIYAECSSTCACGTKCSNQKIRRNQWFKHLEVFDTGKYGQGLRTTAPIPKGTFLCEYVGEVITDEKFHERMINLYSKDEHHYTMKLTQNLVIDAYRMGSVARFANHSCSPNCEFEKWTVDGLQRMCMFSSRPIKAGEELTYDYNFQCFNSQSQQPCYCESAKCRGKIGAKQQTTPAVVSTNNDNHNCSTTMQRLTQREKRIVSQSSIFLLRNLRRIKAKQASGKKNSNTAKQQSDKQSPISLFFTQNYYHSNGSNHTSTLASLRKTPKITHKDMFHLFHNHIRRSHFVKTGRYHHELIDKTCYYAQLSQLTLILNEIFELILYYRCPTDDIIPSNALKKCPSKRIYPAYYQIITKPIDLTLIKNKLDNGDYLTFHLFEQDLLLLFKNAVTYCGASSDEARAVLELEHYFLRTVKVDYRHMLNLFNTMREEQQTLMNLHTFENFIERLHRKEIIDGQIRQVLYEIIYNLDENSDNDSPINYKIVLDSKINSHRTSKSRTALDCIIHCRCGSVHDEISIVQCYACQLWQHVACVPSSDSSPPYYCFECQPACEHNASACLKTNVLIAATLSPLQTYDDNYSSLSTLTRSDGFVIRINECYFVLKQDEKNIDRALTSPEYDILFIERLWFDDDGVGQASGYYYIRPNETFHEPNRKFFPYEVFRFPSSNDPLPISSIVRPCFVSDMATYCKGKPISDNSTRVLSSDLFICEYRVDKGARTFARIARSRQFPTNMKPYCFDNYVEKLAIKREYQPYQKELQQQHPHDNRRRAINNSTRIIHKKLEERHTRLNGIIEKIYCRYHDQTLMPNETKYTIDQLLQSSPTSSTPVDLNNHCHHSQANDKNISISSATVSNKKRRTISLSSDDDIVELIPERDCQPTPKKRSTRQTIISPHKRDEFIDRI